MVMAYTLYIVAFAGYLRVSTHIYIVLFCFNVIKIGSDFGAIFWKKAWAIVQGIFQKLARFFKWP